MSKDSQLAILAGVDGSASADSAARWAAAEADLRNVDLRLLFTYQIPVVGHPEYECPPDFVDAMRIAGQATLDRVAGEAARVYPDLPIQQALKEADARLALVEESKRAGMTAVGTRGKGRVTEVLLGSVALHLAAHGHSPVAVVPRSTHPAGGPILVGADGSPNSDEALGFAFDEAAVRGAELVAMLAWDELSHQRFARRPVIHGAIDEEAGSVLDQQLAPWLAKYPEVPIRKVIYRGPPAAGLVQPEGRSGPEPQLIVVGSRGRGGLSGLVLGSTSQTVIIHSRCPVIIVRAGTTP
jgi:nucleotide-binding universal stress UspA family protein